MLGGCGEEEPGPQGPSSIEEAFKEAHPGGALPPGLQGLDATRGVVAAHVRAVVDDDVQVLLPTHLPEGFKLAAPYIAVGSGGARPNPEGWGDSYRVSYTDGSSLIVLTVGAERAPAGLEWQRAGETTTGAALRAALTESGAVVASLRPPWIVVVGEGLTLPQTLRVTRSLAPAAAD